MKAKPRRPTTVVRRSVLYLLIDVTSGHLRDRKLCPGCSEQCGELVAQRSSRHWVSAIGQTTPGSSPCSGQRHGEPNVGSPKPLPLSASQRAMSVAPELRAVGLYEDEQATRVGQLVGTFRRLGRLDLKGRQHWGYRSIRTPNHTPSRSGSQEIGRNGLRQGVSLSRCRV